jgi:hypothetical protein
LAEKLASWQMFADLPSDITYTTPMSAVLDQAILIHKYLLGAGIEHLLLGDQAISATGNPRFGNDLDFVVASSNRLLATNCLREHGFRVVFDSSNVCQFDGYSPVDVLFAEEQLFREMRTYSSKFVDSDLSYIGIEGIIALKIQAYIKDPRAEQKELDDIANLVEVKDGIDWGVIKAFADLFKQWHRIEAIKGVATKVTES